MQFDKRTEDMATMTDLIGFSRVKHSPTYWNDACAKFWDETGLDIDMSDLETVVNFFDKYRELRMPINPNLGTPINIEYSCGCKSICIQGKPQIFHQCYNYYDHMCSKCCNE